MCRGCDLFFGLKSIVKIDAFGKGSIDFGGAKPIDWCAWYSAHEACWAASFFRLSFLTVKKCIDVNFGADMSVLNEYFKVNVLCRTYCNWFLGYEVWIQHQETRELTSVLMSIVLFNEKSQSCLIQFVERINFSRMISWHQNKDEENRELGVYSASVRNH